MHDAFQNLKFDEQKVSENVNTFENLKTDLLFRRDEMKVTCRNRDRGLNFKLSRASFSRAFRC